MSPTVKPSAACHSVASEEAKESGSLIVFMRRHPDCAEDALKERARIGSATAWHKIFVLGNNAKRFLEKGLAGGVPL